MHVGTSYDVFMQALLNVDVDRDVRAASKVKHVLQVPSHLFVRLHVHVGRHGAGMLIWHYTGNLNLGASASRRNKGGGANRHNAICRCWC